MGGKAKETYSAVEDSVSGEAKRLDKRAGAPIGTTLYSLANPATWMVPMASAATHGNLAMPNVNNPFPGWGQQLDQAGRTAGDIYRNPVARKMTAGAATGAATGFMMGGPGGAVAGGLYGGYTGGQAGMEHEEQKRVAKRDAERQAAMAQQQAIAQGLGGGGVQHGAQMQQFNRVMMQFSALRQAMEAQRLQQQMGMFSNLGMLYGAFGGQGGTPQGEPIGPDNHTGWGYD